MRELIAGVLKALLVAELHLALPLIAKVLVVMSTALFIPKATRKRWRQEWLGELEELEDEGERLKLFGFALQKILAAPGVGWHERTKGVGLSYLPVAARDWLLNRRLQGKRERLAALDRYALTKHDLNLRVKQVIIGFLAVPALWFAILYSFVYLAGQAQAQPYWWLVLVPELIFLGVGGPLLFLGRLNTLLDTGFLVRQVLAYPSARARLVRKISVLEMQVGGGEASAAEPSKVVIAQNGQLVLVGQLSQKPRHDFGVWYNELQALNLGPGHLVAQSAHLQITDDIAFENGLFLYLKPGESAPVLSQALLDKWANEFNTQNRRYTPSAIGPIDREVKLTIKAAGTAGPLEASHELHLQSKPTAFYLWNDEER